jgi:hypothetical protein
MKEATKMLLAAVAGPPTMTIQAAAKIFMEAVAQARFSINVLQECQTRTDYIEELLRREERTCWNAVQKLAEGDEAWAIEFLTVHGKAEVLGLVHALRNCGVPKDYIKYLKAPPPAILPSKCGYCGAERFPANGWYCPGCGGA